MMIADLLHTLEVGVDQGTSIDLNVQELVRAQHTTKRKICPRKTQAGPTKTREATLKGDACSGPEERHHSRKNRKLKPKLRECGAQNPLTKGGRNPSQETNLKNWSAGMNPRGHTMTESAGYHSKFIFPFLPTKRISILVSSSMGLYFAVSLAIKRQ